MQAAIAVTVIRVLKFPGKHRSDERRVDEEGVCIWFCHVRVYELLGTVLYIGLNMGPVSLVPICLSSIL